MGLEHAELIMDLEEEFCIRIDVDEDFFKHAKTVGAFYELVLDRIRRGPATALSQRPDLEAHVWERLVERSAELGSGMRPDQITAATRYVEDLGFG